MRVREIGCLDFKRSFGFNCLQIYGRPPQEESAKSQEFVMHLLMWQPAQLVRYTLLMLIAFWRHFLVR